MWPCISSMKTGSCRLQGEEQVIAPGLLSVASRWALHGLWLGMEAVCGNPA